MDRDSLQTAQVLEDKGANFGIVLGLSKKVDVDLKEVTVVLDAVGDGVSKEKPTTYYFIAIS